MKKVYLLAFLLIGVAVIQATAREARLVRYPHYHQGRIAFTYLADIWTADENGQNLRRITVHKARDVYPRFSPDGRWIAYQSNETGSFEIWVLPFPGPGNRVRISHNGGTQVRWRRDGKELFYIALDGRLMAVSLEFGSQGQTLEPGMPAALFATRIGGALQGFNRHQYAVAPDGQRFLMNTVTGEATSTITVIHNWKERPE